jgi:hypothetical protein
VPAVLALLLLGACARPQLAGPAPELRFRVIGAADSGTGEPPVVRVAGGVLTVRGTTRRVEGGGVYADVDLSHPGTVRLTLYDSLPGRPVDAALPAGVRYRDVVYQATLGPLAPGDYELVVGRFRPGARLIEVEGEPVPVAVPAARSRKNTK